MGTSKPQTWCNACDGGVEGVTGFRGPFTHGETIGHPPPPNLIDVEPVGKTLDRDSVVMRCVTKPDMMTYQGLRVSKDPKVLSPIRLGRRNGKDQKNAVHHWLRGVQPHRACSKYSRDLWSALSGA